MDGRNHQLVTAYWVTDPLGEGATVIMTLKGGEAITYSYSSIQEVPGDAPATLGAWPLTQPGRGSRPRTTPQGNLR